MEIKEMRKQPIEAASNERLRDVAEIIRSAKDPGANATDISIKAIERIFAYLTIVLPATELTEPFIAAAAAQFAEMLAGSLDDMRRAGYKMLCGLLKEHCAVVTIKTPGGRLDEEGCGNDGE